MHDTAAHLVDRVVPCVPMRQWVVTFPRRVRYHLAADPRLASEALREMLREIFAFQRRAARDLGERPSRACSNAAVTFVQRCNSALELSLHFHSLIPDGVFVRDGRDRDARPRPARAHVHAARAAAAIVRARDDRARASHDVRVPGCSHHEAVAIARGESTDCAFGEVVCAMLSQFA